MFQDMILKAALTGATSAVASVVMFGNVGIGVSILGNDVQTSYWIFAGAVGGASSILTDIGHTIFKPEIDSEDKHMDISSMIMSAALGGALYAGIHCVVSPETFEQIGASILGGIGAGSEVVAAYGCPMLKDIL